jgi:hypothetical protein
MNSSGKSETKFHIDPPGYQSRTTVFFRLILILPQLLVNVFLSYAMMLLTIPGWFIALFTGRNPFHRLTSDMLRWYYRVNAYGMLLTDRYPPFRLITPLYPVDVDFEEEPLGRLSVFFRLILAIPAYVVVAILGSGMGIFALAAWLITLIRGKMPTALHGALAAQLRFSLRVASYFYLLQSAYPGGLLGDSDVALATDEGATMSSEVAPSAIVAEGDTAIEAPTESEGDGEEQTEVPVASWSQDWTLRLTSGARRIVVISLVLGVVTLPLSIYVGYVIGRNAGHSAEQTWSTSYESRVATLNADTKNAIVALSSSAPNWPAIGAACRAVNTDLQALATVPQYPAHGPDQLLLNGFGAIYRADLACVSAALGQRSSDRAAVAGSMQVGSTDLIAFLDSIPAP